MNLAYINEGFLVRQRADNGGMIRSAQGESGWFRFLKVQ